MRLSFRTRLERRPPVHSPTLSTHAAFTSKAAPVVKKDLEAIPENSAVTPDFKPQKEMPQEEDLNNW